MEPFLKRSLTGTQSLSSGTNNSWQLQLATIWGLRTLWMLGLKRSNRRPRSLQNTFLSRNNTTQIRPTVIVKSNWDRLAWLRTCQVFTIETTRGRANITTNQRNTSTGTWPSSQVPSSWSLKQTSYSRMNWSTTMITWVLIRTSTNSGRRTLPQIAEYPKKTELSRIQVPYQTWFQTRSLLRKTSMHLSLTSVTTPLTQQLGMEVELSVLVRGSISLDSKCQANQSRHRERALQESPLLTENITTCRVWRCEIRQKLRVDSLEISSQSNTRWDRAASRVVNTHSTVISQLHKNHLADLM